jgi:hypothetical protein
MTWLTKKFFLNRKTAKPQNVKPQNRKSIEVTIREMLVFQAKRLNFALLQAPKTFAVLHFAVLRFNFLVTQSKVTVFPAFPTVLL